VKINSFKDQQHETTYLNDGGSILIHKSRDVVCGYPEVLKKIILGLTHSS